jgi:hypothetical protein
MRVDVYNASSNSWTSYPTGLGLARGYLAAASLPSGLVFFAGGSIGVRQLYALAHDACFVMTGFSFMSVEQLCVFFVVTFHQTTIFLDLIT